MGEIYKIKDLFDGWQTRGIKSLDYQFCFLYGHVILGGEKVRILKVEYKNFEFIFK